MGDEAGILQLPRRKTGRSRHGAVKGTRRWRGAGGEAGSTKPACAMQICVAVLFLFPAFLLRGRGDALVLLVNYTAEKRCFVVMLQSN